MKQSILRIFLALILAVICTNVSSAQTAIERVVKQLEQDESTTMTYTEQRDPSTKKVVSSNRVYVLKDKKLMKTLKEAFEKERENTVNATYTSNNIVFTFPDGSRYCLNGLRSSTYTLVINIGGSTSKSSDSKSRNNRRKNKSSSSSVTVGSAGQEVTILDNYGCANTIAIN